MGQQLGLNEVTVEGDSQAIINMINNHAVASQEAKTIIRDVQILPRSFHSCVFLLFADSPIRLLILWPVGFIWDGVRSLDRARTGMG